MEALSVQTPLGEITLYANEYLLKVEYTQNQKSRSNHPLLKKTAEQLNAYFSGNKKQFNLPVRLEGTSFEKTVWQALLEIPYGETLTYGELAAKIGKPRAARAVGNAMGKNPIPIIVPCHRVLRKNSLGGYTSGTDKKRFLLKLENPHFSTMFDS